MTDKFHTMEESDLCTGSIIFAKLRGFSYWPAKICQKITKKTSVLQSGILW